VRQSIYNLERQKTAIFANLRTFEAKFPLFSMVVPWEPKTTIPENRPENLIFLCINDERQEI